MTLTECKGMLEKSMTKLSYCYDKQTDCENKLEKCSIEKAKLNRSKILGLIDTESFTWLVIGAMLGYFIAK